MLQETKTWLVTVHRDIKLYLSGSMSVSPVSGGLYLNNTGPTSAQNTQIVYDNTT